MHTHFRPTLPLLCLLLALSGCAHNQAREEASRATVTLSGDGKRLVYNGKIKASTVDDALALYQAAYPKPDTLDISSQGGSLYDGIRLGMLVYKQQLDVRVFGECASSCANYIFPAGRNKYLLPNSRLLWHGGMLQADWRARIQQRYPDDAQARLHAIEENDWIQQYEAAFFRQIGVNPLLTVCGQHPAWRQQFPDAHGFDYSLEDLARFGVSHIHMIGRSWRAAIGDSTIFRASYCDSAPAISHELINNASRYEDDD
ncbi:MAG: hypothetical protein ACRC02_11075 [Vogesella sp.]|uniref:hypothetical protein n=1 Tax=Vogesella sp. TaxID=1904252 RepID=UPI003F350E6C